MHKVLNPHEKWLFVKHYTIAHKTGRDFNLLSLNLIKFMKLVAVGMKIGRKMDTIVKQRETQRSADIAATEVSLVAKSQ